MSEGAPRVVAGRYALTRALGRGGMGVVWQARDGLLHRDVAIKEIHLPAAGDDPTDPLVRRALREARAAAQLRHPGIITVHDVVTEDGRPWIVMELVGGRSLAEIIRAQGMLSAWRTAEIGLRVLEALRAAHRHGILHRDVKPANILIDEDRVVLTDFGIAAVDGATVLTATGQMVGSPSYLSPERINGEAATPAADLWGLGVTLYASVTGRPAFHGEDTGATLAAVLTRQPVPPAHAGQLWPVIKGLLAKDPGQRLTADQAAPLLAVAARPSDTPQPAGLRRFSSDTVSGTLVAPSPTIAAPTDVQPPPGKQRPPGAEQPARPAATGEPATAGEPETGEAPARAAAGSPAADPDTVPEETSPAVRPTVAGPQRPAAPTADTVPADTATADTVPADTATADTVPADTLRADTATAVTVRADTLRADTAPADTAPADTVRVDAVAADVLTEPAAPRSAGDGPPTGAHPRPAPSTRPVAPGRRLAAAAAAVAGIIALTVTVVHFATPRGRNAASPIAASPPGAVSPSVPASPSPRHPPGIDPCLLGTWRVTMNQAWGLIDDTRVLYTGGAGTVVVYRADGTSRTDYSKMRPRTTRYRGATWSDVHRGTVSGRYYADRGAITDTITKSNAVDTLRRNGKVNARTPVAFFPEPSKYRCKGNDLYTYSEQGNYSAHMIRVSGPPG